jgi:hypothetical protein
MTVKPSYMIGRKAYSRPQAILWADLPPTVTEDGQLIPVGYEVGSDSTGISAEAFEQSFLILSDHNRSQINVRNERIEQRQRMANGTMRSFFIADKLSIDLSWAMIPSRGFAVVPNFEQDFGTPAIITEDNKNSPPPNTYFAHKSEKYTTDGGAGGGEMLDWYENHTGPFWVLLSYDKYSNFGNDNSARRKLEQYSQVIQMYISSFDYSVVKRGGNNFDMWDVSVTLEEV